MSLMYGIAAVLALWWLSTVFARADVRAVAKAGKMIAGILSLGAAVLLGLNAAMGPPYHLVDQGRPVLGNKDMDFLYVDPDPIV